eukprot:2183052-Amphidinium_carterae.1
MKEVDRTLSVGFVPPKASCQLPIPDLVEPKGTELLAPHLLQQAHFAEGRGTGVFERDSEQRCFLKGLSTCSEEIALQTRHFASVLRLYLHPCHDPLHMRHARGP